MIDAKVEIIDSVKFKELKVGDHFKYNNRLYTKMKPIEDGINADCHECFSRFSGDCYVQKISVK